MDICLLVHATTNCHENNNKLSLLFGKWGKESWEHQQQTEKNMKLKKFTIDFEDKWWYSLYII